MGALLTSCCRLQHLLTYAYISYLLHDAADPDQSQWATPSTRLTEDVEVLHMLARGQCYRAVLQGSATVQCYSATVQCYGAMQCYGHDAALTLMHQKQLAMLCAPV